MSNFVDRINSDIKQAMRDKKAEELSILRMLLSALKNKKIDLGNKDELTEEESLAVIKSEVKKRKDSFASYTEAGREDLASKEKAEIVFLSQYLPEEMSEEEVEKIVKTVIAGIENPSPQNFGQIMAAAMKECKGQADGQVVSATVKKLLA